MSTTDTTTIKQGSYQNLVYFKTSKLSTAIISASTDFGYIVDPFQFNTFATIASSSLNKILFYGPNTTFVNECTPFVALLANGENAFLAPELDSTIDLKGQDVGQFYSDSSCTASTTSTKILANSTFSVFYFKSSYNKNYILQGQVANFTPSLLNLSVNGLALAGAASSSPTRLLMVGSSNHISGSCSSFSVILADASSQPYPAPMNVSVNLKSSQEGVFYSDPACTTSVSSTTIGAGLTYANFYFKTSQQTSFVLQAESTNYATAVFPISFSSNSAESTVRALTLTGSQNLDLNQCSPYSVNSVNNAGIPTQVVSPVSVDLVSKNGGQFFSDSSCTNSITNVIIATNKNINYFYYKNPSPLTDLVLTSNASFADSSLAIKINGSSTSSSPKVIITGVPNVQTNQCAAFNIVSVDSLGNQLNVNSNLTIAISGNSNGSFYSNSNCTTTITNIQIPSGASTSTFYFKANSATGLVLNAQAVGYLSSLFPLTIVAASSEPVALKMVGATAVNNNVCIPFTINATDSNGNNAVTISAVTATLSNIGGNGEFYSDACITKITSITINAGTSYSSFYYKNTTPQSSLIIASTSGLGVASLPIEINNSTNPPVAFKIAGMTTLSLNTCSPYVITAVDINDLAQSVSSNTTVTLSGNGVGGLFYSNNICTTLTTSIVINKDSSFQTFYFKGSSSENLVLLASSLNFSLGSLPISVSSPNPGETVTPLTPVMFGLAGPDKILANSCSGPYTLSVLDSNGVLSNVTSTKTVSILSGSVTSSAYTDGSCSTSLTSLSMASGTNTHQFYLLNSQAGSMTLQASEPSLITATMQINTVQPGVLSISGGPLGAWQAFYYNGNGALVDQILTVTNMGQTQTLNLQESGVLTNGFSYKGGSFPGQGGSCTSGLNLAPGAKCTLVLRFQPSSASNFGSTLQLSFNDGTSDRFSSISLSGQGSSTLTVKQIAAGGNHTCFLYSDMTVKCFGNNSNGQLGIGSTVNVGQAIGSTDFAQTTPIISNAVQIVSGDSHNCALTMAGHIYCWGANSNGQLGTGNSSDVGSNFATITAPFTKVNLGTGRTAVQITAGSFHTCALLDDSNVKCWGNNTYGQLGYEDTTSRGTSASQMGDNLTPINLGTGLTAITIAAGGYHTCALFNTGAIKCWGYNAYGQLGLGDATNRGDMPYTMGSNLQTSNLGGIKVQSLALGLYHSCAIVSIPGQVNNAIKCWGRNNSGQLGYGDTTNRGTSITQLGGYLLNVPLSASMNPQVLGAGRTHTCVMSDGGFVYCWGGNGSGQLGIDTTSTVNNASIATGIYLSSVSLGLNMSIGGNHNCVQLQNSVVKCWGDNSNGQLALRQGSTMAPNWGSSSLRPMANLSETKAATFGYLVDVTMTGNQTCAIWKSGEISCWGISSSNSYSYGSNTVAGAVSLNFKKPAVKGLSVDGGKNGFCFLLDDNSIKCWGSNTHGNYYGSTSTQYYPENPAGFTLPSGYPIKSASVIYNNGAGTCYLSSTGTIYCGGFNDRGSWGYYYFSDLLNGCNANNYCYATSSWGSLNVSNAVDIAFSLGSGCALISDGSVKCWGFNNGGEVANGTTSIVSTSSNIISTTTLGGNATQLQMGYGHTCVLIGASGAVKCWGLNTSGQVGSGTSTSNITTPTTVNLGTGFVATQIANGSHFSCALNTAGKIKCWGDNNFGQLGIESTTQQGSSGSTIGDSLPFAKLPTDFTATKIYTNNNSDHVCARGYLNGNPFLVKLYCWGRNTEYQLGDGTTVSRGTGANQMSWSIPAISNSSVQISDFNSTDYRAPGGYTYTVPDGVNQIYVQAWGGGAAGGIYTGNYYGGQGGGGAYASKVYNVSPGQTFSVNVGNGAKSSYYGGGNGYYGYTSNVGSSSFSSMSAGGGKTIPSISTAGGQGGAYNGADWGANGFDGATTYNSVGNLINSGGSFLGGLGGFTISLGGEYPGGAGATCYNSSLFTCYMGGVGSDGRVLVTAVSNYIPPGSSGGSSTSGADYTIPGVYVYKTPTGTNSVRVQLWGAGGGGGGAWSGGSPYYCGEGGGAGGYVDYIFNINPGQSIYVNVGAGGAGGTFSTALTSTNGGVTSVGLDGTTLSAYGGYGGYVQGGGGGANCTNAYPYYCQGGNATGGYTNSSGGSGVNGNGYYSGGWSAGSTISGTGGSAYLGGAGGTGVVANANQNGNNGGFPGGGGSGACSNTTGFNGGAGANGRVIITPQ